MKLITSYEGLFDKLSVWSATAIRAMLNVLLFIIIAALLIGIFKSGTDLFRSLHDPLESILQKMLLDVVFIVALVEISITVLGYLKDGYVHVRYIVDTILIIMLNEIVSLWFKHPQLNEMIGIAVIVVTLAAVRVVVTRFAPVNDRKS